LALGNHVGADPVDQPRDAGIGARGVQLRKLKHLVHRGQLCTQFRDLSTDPTEPACCVGRSILVRGDGCFGRLLLDIHRKLVRIEAPRHEGLCRSDRRGSLLLLDQGEKAFAVDFQGPQEGGDRRKQALLQPDECELRVCRVSGRKSSDPLGAQLAIGGKHLRQLKLGGRRGQAVEHDRLDAAPGKGLRIDPPQI
jgi:hypothetical protein